MIVLKDGSLAIFRNNRLAAMIERGKKYKTGRAMKPIPHDAELYAIVNLKSVPCVEILDLSV